MITVKCVQCSSEFTRESWEKKRFCSRRCYYDSRVGVLRPEITKPPVAKTCEACGGEFFVGGAGRPSAKQRYCSMACQSASRFRRGTEAAELAVVDAAYLAGLLDGEGSIMLLPRGSAFQLKVTISNTKRPVLDWVATTTGVGNITVVTQNKNPNAANGHILAFNGSAAESLLRQIAPLMRIKHEQAELAVWFHERLRVPALKADREWQVEACETMRALNRRGGFSIRVGS